jgi:CheY-like chemotaxis protein
VLDFSRIEAGRLELDEAPFALAGLVEEVARLMSPPARGKGLRFHWRMTGEVPPFVKGDATRLRQVLLNLLGNAVKFTREGAVDFEVTAKPVEDGRLAVGFEVLDTGVGIPPDKLTQIFEAFSQADTSTTRKYGGTGLGLTICASLAALMGGRIWLENDAGQGSCFCFTVQVLNAPTNPVTVPETEPEREREPDSTVHRLSILLAEDNPLNQRLAILLLERWGHEVVLAQDGVEAVTLFGQRPFDLVLMDMQMPEMDGLEATRAIREAEADGRRTPIIAMTANAMNDDRELCLAAGMDAFLSKPFEAVRFKAMVDQMAAGGRPAEGVGIQTSPVGEAQPDSVRASAVSASRTQ